MAQKSILSDKPGILIKKFKVRLREVGIPVEKIILFGSYAKGKQKPWSDLDLCVVSKKFGKDRYDELVYLNNVASVVEPMIEAHPYNPKDLLDPYDGFAHEIRTTGKVV